MLLFFKCFHWLAEDRVDFVSIYMYMGYLLNTVSESKCKYINTHVSVLFHQKALKYVIHKY